MEAEDRDNQSNTVENNPPSAPSSTSQIFKKFQRLYAHQLKETGDTSDGLKLKVKILENWVGDLTEQNVMLVQTVEELETEALKRLSMLEANLTQSQDTTQKDCISGSNTFSSKGLNCRVETLCRELDQVKRQLSDKEKLISKYQSRIEELSSSIEGEKSDDCNKVFAQHYSKPESICDHDRNVQPSVYREETLVEVLGIKERSLSHMEHLTEQLEQKDQVISCLKQQLTQGSADLLYRVRQQVEWFTENVTQQCSQGNCSEEFKKCITTMLEELKESIECCNLGPTDTTELSKVSIKFVSALQKRLELSKKDLCESWAFISDTVHQMNKADMSPLVDQWKKGFSKQKSLHQKLQEVVRSIINISSSNVNVECITKSMDSLQCLLFRFTDELNNQPRERSFTGWLKSLHCVVTEVISKIQEITEIICAIRNSDNETHSQLVCKIQLVDSLQWDLNEALCTEAKAYEKLCKKEKAQKIKVDTLLATVLHHEEIWNQQVSVTNDLMREIWRLSDDTNKNPKQTSHNETRIPSDERSKHLQGLVSKISADIRKSICDIEHRQNQVSHLELDLSSVRLVLESAQLEIDEISKTCNTQEVRRKVTALLLKLKKQISNALTKANNLVKAYNTTKQEYLCSSERILQLQKDCEVLEQEVRCHWAQLSKDFKKPQKTDKGLCTTERVLETYERKCPGRLLQTQFLGVQKALQKEDAAIQNVKGNIMDLKSNIKDRDKLTDTQDKTICVLQNSLKICHNEAEELRKTIHCLDVRKCEIEIESKKKNQELRSKISELQNCLKKYEEVNKNHQKTEEALKLNISNLKETICKEQKKFSELENKNKLLEKQIENCRTSSNAAQDKEICLLKNSLKTSQKEIEKLCQTIECLELKKADTEKDHKEQIEKLKNKICELQNDMRLNEDTNVKHHKSEAALQLVISNLKETICKERKKCSEIEKENKKLQENVKELEDYSISASKSNEETDDKISDLEKQVKCWSKKALDFEGKLKCAQEKLCKSLKREKELELELSSKDSKYKEEICVKQKEIMNLTNAIQSLTEKLSESTTELDTKRLKLQNVCGAYEELKVKEREKEAQADKLQVALTQLSNKFVSRRLETGTSHCLRHYQEECAKYEALYNTTACKLRSKELEISSLKQEVERMRSDLDHITMTTSHQKEDESCPFLMERVHQLAKELQVAHSCQNSYESLLKDVREKYSKKEEETFLLKAQIKQITLQRDTVLADLEQAKEEINRFKINNSNLHTTIKRLEQNNAQVSEQLHKVMYDSDTAGTPQLQPNIELQREISTALSSQLRGVKQKLHSTKHDYKLLQAAYEELNRKYATLQRGERDVEKRKEVMPASKPATRCRPCLAKSSKSVTYIKMPESLVAQDPVHVEFLSHSKSWHKMNNNKDIDWKERKWKQKLQNVIRGDFSPSEAMHHSSSSN